MQICLSGQCVYSISLTISQRLSVLPSNKEKVLLYFFKKQYRREHSKYTSLAEGSKSWPESTLEGHITHYYANDFVEVFFSPLDCIHFKGKARWRKSIKGNVCFSCELPCTKCPLNHLYLNSSIPAYAYRVSSFSENARHTHHYVGQYYRIRFSNYYRM